MQVKLSQAVKMFFGNSSLEMVFFEAIANALDAEANEITISITAKALNQPETLQIEISDNGLGFTNERYNKFSKLFDVEESSHKGLGRLVYLCYFDDVKVISNYDKVKVREFDFNEGFKEDNLKQLSSILLFRKIFLHYSYTISFFLLSRMHFNISAVETIT